MPALRHASIPATPLANFRCRVAIFNGQPTVPCQRTTAVPNRIGSVPRFTRPLERASRCPAPLTLPRESATAWSAQTIQPELSTPLSRPTQSTRSSMQGLSPDSLVRRNKRRGARRGARHLRPGRENRRPPGPHKRYNPNYQHHSHDPHNRPAAACRVCPSIHSSAGTSVAVSVAVPGTFDPAEGIGDRLVRTNDTTRTINTTLMTHTIDPQQHAGSVPRFTRPPEHSSRCPSRCPAPSTRPRESATAWSAQTIQPELSTPPS
jgi:hypothetical protein